MKKVITCLLTLCLILSCAACGNSEKPAPESGSTPRSTDSTQKDSGNAPTAAASENEDGEFEDDAEEIILAYPIIGTVTQDGAARVEAAINEISEKSINVHVTIKPIELGNYAQQINLMITSNEALDIVCTFPSGSSSFSSMCSQNQLQPLDELVDEYGPDIKANLGQLLDATKMNGTLYSLTTYFNKSASTLIAMRTDILEKYDLVDQAENAKSFADIEKIYDVILEKEPQLSPVSAGMGGSLFSPAYVDMCESFEDATLYDALGDNNYLVAVDYASDTPTVYNHFASESYKKACDMARRWYEKGYVYKDSATTTDDADTLIRSNVVFSMIYKGGVDSPDAKRATTGYDLTVIELNPIPVSTGSSNVFTWGIPTTCQSPEAAMQFLNLMYSNADINNLLAWGVEGEDYVVTAENTADYPEGQDSNSSQYHTTDFLYGNNFAILPWAGTAPDMRQQQLDAMNKAEMSPYLGFTLDTSALQNELTAVTNVINEYKVALDYGTINPETELPKFIEKLNDSGAQKIIDEAQRQLDEWLAANK